MKAWNFLLIVVLGLVLCRTTLGMEVVHFESGVAPPSPFKLKQAKAKGLEIKQESGFPIWGHLSRPDGGGRFPSIVMLYGCSGISPSNVRWASQFVAWGYVVLMVDSLGPLSELDVCKEPTTIVSMDKRSFKVYGVDCVFGYISRI